MPLLSDNHWLNGLFCSLPVSAVQRSLQKTPFWRDRSHHHESARRKFHFHGFTGANESLTFLKYTFQNSATKKKKKQGDIVPSPRLHLVLLSLSQDFRNYQYTLPVVKGLVVDMEVRKTSIKIPSNRYNEVSVRRTCCSPFFQRNGLRLRESIKTNA